MLRNERLSVIMIIILSLAFPLFIWGVGVMLSVDTTDVSNRVVSRNAENDVTTYVLDLERPDDRQRYEMMFRSTGNIITVASAGETIYEYGAEEAAAGEMIGTVYAHVFLNDSVYEEPLRVSLEAHDRNADAELGSVDLCPHGESIRYYITNKTIGFSIALVFVAVAFCLPIFLLLAGEWRLIRQGLLFGLVLLCFAILLLDHGGHYLVFTSNQPVWNKIQYLTIYLFPAIVLWYFYGMEETTKPLNRLVFGGALVNSLFFLAAAAAGLSGAVHFCDMLKAFQVVLILDAAIGIYVIYRNVRHLHMSKMRVLLLIVAVFWVILVIVTNALSIYLSRTVEFPRFDLLSLCAIITFYFLCYFLAESVFAGNRRERERDLLIETLEQIGQENLSYESIAKAIFERYESIYCVDMDTHAYKCYYASTSYREFGIDEEGDDFFLSLKTNIPATVYKYDQDYVLGMLTYEALKKGLEEDRYYSFIYRLVIDGVPVFHQFRATKEDAADRNRVIIGIRNIDAMMRREKEYTEGLESMLQKEKTHMEAILATAAGYMAANLSQDLILEKSEHFLARIGLSESDLPDDGNALSYSDFERWWGSRMVVSDVVKFNRVSDRQYLIDCFNRDERRVSILFSARTSDGTIQPCRQAFYLYQDRASEDIMCFCVIYDLTEQQKKEREMRELETALRMSRIRNFTGQMQPHFLYNALGSIQEIVLEDPEYASELLGDFTIHLRSCIRAMADDKEIPFSQELDNIRAYVNIEKMRFGEKLKVDYEIEELGFTIIPLSIQPLVENAIRHGIHERGIEGGTVTIRSLQMDDAWIVRVEDDGVGFDVASFRERMKEGIGDSAGLKNIIFRLEKVMGANVDIQSEIGTGTVITVSLPKKGMKK